MITNIFLVIILIMSLIGWIYGIYLFAIKMNVIKESNSNLLNYTYCTIMLTVLFILIATNNTTNLFNNITNLLLKIFALILGILLMYIQYLSWGKIIDNGNRY